MWNEIWCSVSWLVIITSWCSSTSWTTGDLWYQWQIFCTLMTHIQNRPVVCVASTDSAIYLKNHLDRLISKFKEEYKATGWFLNWSSRPSQRHHNRISFLKSQLSKLFFLPLPLLCHQLNCSWSSVLFQTSIYSWDDLKKSQGNLLWLSLD